MADTNIVQKDLGPVSAYAIAVKHGYKGTEEEWAALQIASAENAKAADASAKEAAETLAAVHGTVEQETTAAVAAVNNQETASIQAVKDAAQTAGAYQEERIADKGEQTLASIPDDYTKLGQDVAALNKDFANFKDGGIKAENLYETVKGGTNNLYAYAKDIRKNVVVDKYIATGKVMFIPSDYAYETFYIDVEPNTQYTYNKARYLLETDTEDNGIGETRENTTTITTSALTTRLYITWLTTAYDEFIIQKGTELVPVTNTYTHNPWVMLNPLYGKRMLVDGDSIMYGAGYIGGFAKIIADRNKMVLTNQAASGGTITHGTTSGNVNRHWISDTLTNVSTDYDYYIFDGGVNDNALKVPFGQITSGYDAAFDENTFCGAFEKICKYLVYNLEGKKVGYVFVHRCIIDGTWDEYKNTMIQILNKWGVPYCDLDANTPSLIGVRSLRKYTQNGDGWHPTEEGYKKFYCDKIEAWLRTL